MKKKFLLFTAVLCTSVSNLNAQNVVPNPGFEVQDTCPAVSQIQLASPWVSATLGTPDLFNHTCSTQNLTAHTGEGSSGVYLLNTFANNREYMEAPLTSTLISGQTYCVSFYVKRSNYRYGCNRIGAYFSSTLVNQTTTSALALVPQIDNNPANALTGTGWMQISGSFVASGGEGYIVIGSFSSDANTDTVVVNAASSSKVCFYQVDDISVTACSSGVGFEENLLEESISIYPNPASDVFSITLPTDVNVKSILIYNSLGQEVRNMGNPQNDNGTLVFDNHGMTSGVYMITLLTDKGTVNRKLVIQ